MTRNNRTGRPIRDSHGIDRAALQRLLRRIAVVTVFVGLFVTLALAAHAVMGRTPLT